MKLYEITVSEMKCGPYVSLSVHAFRFIDPYCKCRSVGTDKNQLTLQEAHGP